MLLLWIICCCRCCCCCRWWCWEGGHGDSVCCVQSVLCDVIVGGPQKPQPAVQHGDAYSVLPCDSAHWQTAVLLRYCTDSSVVSQSRLHTIRLLRGVCSVRGPAGRTCSSCQADMVAVCGCCLSALWLGAASSANQSCNSNHHHTASAKDAHSCCCSPRQRWMLHPLVAIIPDVVSCHPGAVSRRFCIQHRTGWSLGEAATGSSAKYLRCCSKPVCGAGLCGQHARRFWLRCQKAYWEQDFSRTAACEGT